LISTQLFLKLLNVTTLGIDDVGDVGYRGFVDSLKVGNLSDLGVVDGHLSVIFFSRLIYFYLKLISNGIVVGDGSLDVDLDFLDPVEFLCEFGGLVQHGLFLVNLDPHGVSLGLNLNSLAIQLISEFCNLSFLLLLLYNGGVQGVLLSFI